LREVATALERFASAQDSAALGCDALNATIDAYYAGMQSQLDNERQAMDGQADDISEAISPLGPRVSSDSFQAVSFMSAAEYEAKRAQLSTAEETFREEFDDVFDNSVRPIQIYGSGVDAYDDERWSDAVEHFGDSTADISAQAERFEEIDGTPAINSIRSQFVADLEALAGSAAELESAAAAQARDESGTAAEQRAQRLLEDASPRLRSVNYVQQVLDFYSIAISYLYGSVFQWPGYASLVAPW
jgi:hypothetical protein